MDAEILKCQVYLHPEEPVDVTSEDVKKYLKVLGWEEGDKIPGGMPEYTSHVLKAMGKPVTVKSLSDMFADETVQVTLKSALNKVKLNVVTQDTIDSKFNELVGDTSTLSEGTVESIKALADIVAKKEVEKEAKEKAAEHIVDTEGIEGLEEVGTDDVPSSDVTEDVEDNTEMTDDSETNEVLEENRHVCPRCGFVLSNKYIPFPVTDEDRIQYVYSVLGGTPFSKTYNVADGLLSITYTVPTAYLNRQVEDQLKYDSHAGRAQTYDQSFVTSIRYGLAISLTNVKSNYGLDKNVPILPVTDVRFKNEDETPIRKYTKYIEDEVIGSGTRETFFRSTYNDFVRLQVQLQNELKAENFIKAVLDKS